MEDVKLAKEAKEIHVYCRREQRNNQPLILHENPKYPHVCPVKAYVNYYDSVLSPVANNDDEKIRQSLYFLKPISAATGKAIVSATRPIVSCKL
jgi:hypothetical protein